MALKSIRFLSAFVTRPRVGDRRGMWSEREQNEVSFLRRSRTLSFTLSLYCGPAAAAPAPLAAEPPPDLLWLMSHCRVMSILSFSLQEML